LDEIFECGVRGGKDRPFLGYRPILSTSPLKHANHFVWQSYADVDIRRRHIGSALTLMFNEGKLGGGEYETVGIWSVNRPGMFESQIHAIGSLALNNHV
jgi:long-chain acyl-CoA synthetase